jgi:hypothetical protein
MRKEHVLLIGSLVIAGPAVCADSGAGTANDKMKGAGAAKDGKPAARAPMADEESTHRANGKARVHRTFAPPTRPL